MQKITHTPNEFWNHDLALHSFLLKYEVQFELEHIHYCKNIVSQGDTITW